MLASAPASHAAVGGNSTGTRQCIIFEPVLCLSRSLASEYCTGVTADPAAPPHPWLLPEGYTVLTARLQCVEQPEVTVPTILEAVLVVAQVPSSTLPATHDSVPGQPQNIIFNRRILIFNNFLLKNLHLCTQLTDGPLRHAPLTPELWSRKRRRCIH